MNKLGERSQVVFEVGRSVTRMAGLTLGSMLTRVIFPVRYAPVFRVSEIDYDN